MKARKQPTGTDLVLFLGVTFFTVVAMVTGGLYADYQKTVFSNKAKVFCYKKENLDHHCCRKWVLERSDCLIINGEIQ